MQAIVSIALMHWVLPPCMLSLKVRPNSVYHLKNTRPRRSPYLRLPRRRLPTPAGTVPPSHLPEPRRLVHPWRRGQGGGDAVNEDGSHNIVQVELDVELQSKAGKAYTKHFVHLADGSKMGTMKRWVAVKVMNDFEAGKPIRLEFTETQWGNDLEGHEVILPESGKAIEPEVIEPVASQDDLPF